MACAFCGQEEEIFCPIAEREAQRCSCLGPLEVVWKSKPMKGFEPRFDYGLGEHVTGWGDIHKAMRENHLDFRDYPSLGDRTARLDRIADKKRLEASRGRV